MLSDVGGALARRRRDNCYISQSFCNFFQFSLHLFLIFFNPSLLLPYFHGGSVLCDNNDKGFSANPLYLLRTVLWPAKLVKEECSLSTCSPNAKSEICLSNFPRSMKSRTFAILVVRNLYRIPSKSTLSSPCSLMERSSVLTPEPLMSLTAEGLHLTMAPMSSSSIASYQFNCGGTLTPSQNATTLGFCLLGLLHHCGPLPQARSISENLSPPINNNRPRFNSYIISPNPFNKLYRLYGLSSRRLCLCLGTIFCIWIWEYFSQILLLVSPLVKIDEIISCKTIAKHLFLKRLSHTHMVSLCGNCFRLSRHAYSATSSPVSTFINHTLKHLETEPDQRPQLGIVNSLIVFQPSRTMTNRSRQNSSFMFGLSLLSDLQGPWHPNFPIMERTSALPSSVMERNLSRSSIALVWVMPVNHEAKYLSSTSQNLMIVTIPKIPEIFAEVSPTHHDLACGMLLANLCLRVSMSLSSKFIAYPTFMYAYSYVCCKPLFQNFVSFGSLSLG